VLVLVQDVAALHERDELLRLVAFAHQALEDLLDCQGGLGGGGVDGRGAREFDRYHGGGGWLVGKVKCGVGLLLL